MHTLQALLLDFDDTLMATYECRLGALIKAASSFGRTLTPDEITRHWGKPFIQLISGILPGIEYSSFKEHYTNVMREFPPSVQPGGRQLLESLNVNQVPVFLISSGSRSLVLQDLEEANLMGFVTRLWCYEDTQYHKPDPRTLTPVLTELGRSAICAAKTIYIGDAVADYHVAHRNQIPFRAVLSGCTRREAFTAVGLPHYYIFRSLDELRQNDLCLDPAFHLES